MLLRLRNLLGILVVWSGFVSLAFVGGCDGKETDDAQESDLEIKEIGQNYLGVAHWLEVTPDGEILPDVMISREKTFAIIQQAHEAGYKVLLMFYPEWYDSVTQTPYPHQGEIEMGPVPAVSQFMDEMGDVVVEIAQQAEMYGVEMLSPMCELNVFLAGDGDPDSYEEVWDKVKQWHQNVIPRIRAVYSGALVPKGEIAWSKYHFETAEGDLSVFSYYSSYDYMAADLFEGDPRIQSLDDYRSYVDRMIAYLQEMKTSYGATGIILGPEIGIHPAAEAIQEACPACQDVEANLVNILFEEGLGKVDGYFFWHEWEETAILEAIQGYYQGTNDILLRGVDIP